MNGDKLLFFSGAPAALPLYERVEEAILRRCPDTRITVQKSQIAFGAKRQFAFASLRGKRLVITFGLGAQTAHPRIAQSTQPYPGRWTHHVILSAPEEIDDTLLGWICEAYMFANR